ncbi:MAG: efflux RND transporter periplasmic adaptor subunit [Gammaproteobacteria bacterium]|nr:efflux RND transporter periplasmic adaptor subunit [Gammaproteobacteria bacterium]MBK8133380.1 efflux RND transporter periplasmic adaptor subunit [Gammaproteobacteria bacterium]MBK9426188.1 efflux RND transporter periplasmic adaptor subunit [Gammaproteobacteria bacterium]
MRRQRWLILHPTLPLTLLLAVAVFAACKPKGADAPVPEPAALVRIEIAATRPMRRILEVYGTADYAPQSQRIVDTTAEVVVEQVLVAPGQAVKPGQPLLRVRSTANSTLELQRARNDRDAADQELRRVQRMFAQRLATNADITAARQGAANADANWQSVSSRIGGTGTKTITADRAINVASVDVSRGDIVASDTPLLHLASSDALSVRLGIEPADLRQVRPGQSVTVRPVYDPATSITGTISEVVRQVDTQTRLTQAIVKLPATDQLLPGSTVRGQIEVQRRDAVLSVPRGAVLREGDLAYLYVANGQRATRVEIKVGEDDGNRIEVLSGLKAGDRVVVEGNYELQDGMAITLTAATVTP